MSFILNATFYRSTFIFLWLIFSFQYIEAQKRFSSVQYFKKADAFKKNAMPDSAIYYFKKAALGFKEKGKTKKLITTYHHIATLLTKKDRFEEGRMYLGMAEISGNALRDSNDLLRATTFLNLGIIYSSMGDFNGALAYHKRALAMRILKSGDHNADVATSYGNMGNVYLIKKEYDLAIESHLKALAIREKLFGVNSVEINQTYNNLGRVFKEKKEYDTSLEYFQKYLKNKITQVGPDHKDLAKIYNSISDVYHLMGNEEQAEFYRATGDAILKKSEE
ncbi:MAG: tetratricopeptide repeat protein [Saprospiraceae bacterium]